MKGDKDPKRGVSDAKYRPLQPPPSLPLLPPPEPPSKLYEDDDFDLYADIETPAPSKLAPPPEPPALLFALDGDDKDEGGEGSDEEAGLVIDDMRDAYDPEMPTSPPSPTPSEVEAEEKKKEQKAKHDELSSIPYPALEDIPPPPSPPPKDRDKDNDSDSECPNQGLYSKLSMQIAKGKSDSDNSDKEDEELPPPPPPPFGSLNLCMTADKSSKHQDEKEVPEDLAMNKCKLTEEKDGDKIATVERMEEDVDNRSESGADEQEEENLESKANEESDDNESPGKVISKEAGVPESPKSNKKAVRESELSEGELEDESSEKESTEPEDHRKEDQVKEDSLKLLGSAVSSEDLPLQSSEGDKPLSESDGRGPKKSLNYGEDSLNGSQESLPSVGKSDMDNGKPSKNKSNLDRDRENDGEPDLLELGCEEERDGLVDITDEEISNYERSWEMEDNGKQGKSAGLEGLETEAISDCEYPPAETDKQDDEPEKTSPNEIVENGNKEEEGEIVTEERTPVQWKKLSKTSKERSYRGDKEVKTKEKNKEITTKKKEKRKELERYDVRKLISEKPRRKVDEFGRDISSNSRSNSRSLSRGRRSLSRGKKKKSKSRSRSKERNKERGRSRERVKERSRDRSRSKDKVRRDRSKDRKSRSRSKKRRRSRSPRKERGRSREKGSRERKKRKKSPSMSCSSCSCSSCEREKRRSNKKLTVIVTNEEVVGGKRGREKGKPKNKEKKGSSPKSRRRNSPVPSKEVFTSGDNILVSVNFKSSKGREAGRSKDAAPSTKRKKDDESKKKKDKGTKENQPVRSIVTAKKSKKKLNTKNMKPVAIIDLDASPFRETIVSPKEVIILSDSDSEDKLPQVDNAMPVLMTGPKTPPEPLIKFNIVNNKQQQLRTMANPLLDSLLEQLEGEGDDEPEEIMHKGPNTPPEPPVPYDPFEPTKSRSPTPGPDTEMDRHMSPTPEGSQRHSPQQLQTPMTPPKLPQHVAPKTPSPLHSPPKVADEPPDNKPKLMPFPPVGIDSDNDSGGGGGGGGGDSPYSPGSSEGDDLFEPPMPQPGPGPKTKSRAPPAQNNKHSAPAKVPVKKRSNKSHKESSKKATSKKEIGIKLDEDQLKILDELPNSAVEMQVKDKFLKKLNRQERVVEEVKMVLKPHYAKKHITKEEYKEILRKSVPKICHSRSGEINPMKIQRLIEAYVKKYRHKSKKRGGAPAIPPLRQNKGKTLWC